MRRIADNDTSLFEALYDRYASRVKGFFLRMLNYDVQRSEDLTQELFLKIYLNRSHFEQGRSVASWVFSIAYNLCKNEYRHSEVESEYRQEMMNGSEAVEPVENMDKEIIQQRLKAVVVALPMEQRAAFMLRYQEELPVVEIAKVLACPEGTVKSRLFHALQTIKEKMKRYT